MGARTDWAVFMTFELQFLSFLAVPFLSLTPFLVMHEHHRVTGFLNVFSVRILYTLLNYYTRQKLAHNL